MANSDRQAAIRAVNTYLPAGRLTNDTLAARFPEWTAERIYEKTGIRERRIAAPEQFASDLAVGAAEPLFREGVCSPAEIDVLVFCTQSPDYLLPTTACLVQSRLGIPTSCMAFDVNQGCSGFVYGLGVVKGLLEAGLGSRGLLLTADTYTKFIHPDDHTVATLFGDAGAATLIDVVPQQGGSPAPIDALVFGTDGSGAKNLKLELLGCRSLQAGGPHNSAGASAKDIHLYMNGPEIFAFTLKSLPPLIQSTLDRAGCTLAEIDLVVFHQANRFMLNALQKKLAIPPEKFVIDLEDTGNTVSCSIPLALARSRDKGILRPGMRVLLAGFGVGYSWGAGVITWPGAANSLV
jgi:3-oxoacyl-[acyl-carrier-protein] synthase-3